MEGKLNEEKTKKNGYSMLDTHVYESFSKLCTRTYEMFVQKR